MVDSGTWAGEAAWEQVQQRYADWLPRWQRAARRLRMAALAGLAAFLGICLLAALLLPHGVLLAAVLAILVLPVLVLSVLTVAAVWLGRRAWRSGAWLEAVPVAVGAPWLGRVLWAARALLAGRFLWRAGRRMRRPLRARRATAYYQDGPGGAWQPAQVRDLTGDIR